MVSRFDFSKFIDTADRLITKFGNACTLVSIVKSARNTSTGLIPETRTSITVQAYLYNDEILYEKETQVERADKKALVSVLNQTVIPKVNDELLSSDGTRYSIQKVTVVEPSGRDIIWKLELKS